MGRIALLVTNAGDMLSNLMALPLFIGGVCIAASIVGTYFVRLGGGKNVMGAMYKGFGITAAISAVLIWFAIDYALGGMEAPIGETGLTGRALYYCSFQIGRANV